ncbi:MAG: hypothetical protein F6K48_30245 [Okeania sp. SIO3H1]|nr:hypothetical protein [Okeania sp. SIO1I7]NEN92943.1 hypothetical protein [Okeania sp. SIO3H1]NET28565.1 hypothetical protein [Okeania sp. SIO1I7]
MGRWPDGEMGANFNLLGALPGAPCYGECSAPLRVLRQSRNCRKQSVWG